MRDLNELLEQCDQFSTVLIARKSPESTDSLVQLLVDAGVNVLGPVDTAARALAIVAQTPADFAVVTPELAGKRNGAELARRLEDTWGVPSVVVAPAA
ncbi:hypothetical protein [Phenylobacterium zucineum]|uniref:hypothetical protein n=1 Tax=Phenylobacterium zucineum TaxID=284016 RepID=UPI00059BCF30|nr:hypothetical protein [Phenylobacterium zucineum]